MRRDRETIEAATSADSAGLGGAVTGDGDGNCGRSLTAALPKRKLSTSLRYTVSGSIETQGAGEMGQYVLLSHLAIGHRDSRQGFGMCGLKWNS